MDKQSFAFEHSRVTTQRQRRLVKFSSLGKELFAFLCLLLTGFAVVMQVLRFIRNEDTSTIIYKPFNKSPKDKYPTFSLCFSSTPWNSLQYIFDKDLVGNHAIDSYEWNMLMKGYAIKRKHWNTTLHRMDFFGIYPQHYTLSMEPFLKPFLNTAIKLEAKNETKEFGQYKKQNESWPFYVSYTDPDKICYTRRTESKAGLIQKNDMIWLSVEYFKASKVFLNIHLHHTGQLTRSFGTPDYKLYGMEVDNSNAKATLKVGHVSVLRRRKNSNVPCDEYLIDDDKRFRDEVAKQVGCIPDYWKSIVPWNNNVKICTAPDELSKIFHLLQNKEGVLSSYKQPCDYMKVGVAGSQQPYFHGYILIDIAYLYEDYQEVINLREFGFGSFGSGVGGFVGMFLGYSFLQIPDSLQKLGLWIASKIILLGKFVSRK